MPFWLKRTFQVLAALIVLIIIVFIGLAMYVNVNKKELLISINKELNRNINGTVTVGAMEPTFLRGFPGVSVSLKNVEIRDSLWKVHHHSLLTAKDFDISVNAMALLRGTIEIRKIAINNAEAYLYTDSTGYSNTSVFKKKAQAPEQTKEESASPAEIRRFDLNDVRFILDNRKGNKLFLFAIQDFSGKVDYPSSGWKADVNLKTLVRSLAFNTKRGSFVKDKLIQGKMDVSYDNELGEIEVKPKVLKIGEDPFIIGAKFKIAKDPTAFTITIEARSILWKNASALLAPNIASRLNMFNLDKPIAVKCIIDGDMGGGGDPSILVNASVKANKLTSPGGVIDHVNFSGVYTNNFINGKGFTDANSAVKLYRFSGSYAEIPFTIDTAFIHNFDKPVATGVFKSKFDVSKLNNVIGDDMLKFTKGTANLELHYSADLVNFKLNKPMLRGLVSVKNADVSYVPRNLNFKNTSITLDFQKEDLQIRDIRLQSGKSIVFMDGSIKNFLNLYYNAPEKIMFNWNMRSPDIYLAEFLGFLSSRKGRKVQKSKGKSNVSANQLNQMLEKGKAQINLKVARVHYDKFLGTNATATVLLSDAGLNLTNTSLRHAGGTVKLGGSVTQIGTTNHFTVNTVVSNVNIRDFFYSFDNFGLKSPTYKNLKGNFFTRTNVSGNITPAGKIVPGSMNGTVIFDLKNGALVNYQELQSVGKFAFPFRDLNNIVISNLNGKFDIRGEKVRINPMKINSSVLNMDVEGIYSMGAGTNILLDVPLRNPKKDEEITDKKEIRERRMKGIVVHIQALDGEDGKIKFKLVRKRSQDKTE
ncbi:AsmA family protein [Pedobacter sp. MC2016-15]|uniref:AsmA family protein n=1 Tax=Pedobacter sp. MC2016-15 TaxID=2994473 RepID=UPI002246479E|nr:AsmA family protein [Pedobacter sp. MC2016-15]MCX2480806.1 AsmA family protein [Pedobacter sp. MC2016-15]